MVSNRVLFPTILWKRLHLRLRQYFSALLQSPAMTVSLPSTDSSPEDNRSDDESKALSTPDSSPPCPRTQSQARSFVFICLCIGIVFLSWATLSRKKPSASPVATIKSDPIDINAADWTTFSQLDGIGPTIAFRIVADREHFGRFETVDDIQRVEGIGPLTLDRIRSRLTIGHDQLKHTEQKRQPAQ